MTGFRVSNVAGASEISAVPVVPDFRALSPDVASMVGALVTIVLVVSVAVITVGAVVWALTSSAGHQQAAARARMAVWTALGTAVLAGGTRAYLDFLLEVGREL